MHFCCVYVLNLFLSACPLSSMVPLLQLISRGSPMTFEDSNRIIPLFYLFSSLFSHSLISVHDSEFFGHELEGSELFAGIAASYPTVAGYPVNTLICRYPFPSFGGFSQNYIVSCF